jgi:hypothetical protein
MARRAFSQRLHALVVVLVAGAGLTLLIAPAGASSLGPVRVQLIGLANESNCPQANYVVVSQGSGQSQLFLEVPPGPAGCPGGLDLNINPGTAGAPSGEANALPLTADSCQAGTALLDSQITALGQSQGGIGAGPPGGNSVCPGGDAAFAQLQTSFDLVSRLLEAEGIFYFFQHDSGHHSLVVAGAPGVPALTGVYDVATGTPEGAFTVSSPGSSPVLYVLQPSDTAGVATVVCAFCSP